MIVKELVNPNSIVIVGASNNVEKPGGKITQNIIEGGFDGELYAVNPKEKIVQGIRCFNNIADLPKVELGIIAVPANFVSATVEELARDKGTRAFIVISAGFSEIGPEGKKLEEKLLEIVNKYDATLIGPNCIGVITNKYKGVFAGPIPKLDPKGCDCVSASGATMVFILEVAIPRGLTFSNIFSVGNSIQVGVEEIIEYWDETFDPENSSKIKLIYTEKISKPDKFLKHCTSLIKKGCKIAAIKAGTTEAGSRAVSSHTGALAGSDTAVSALFNKAGIVRCHSRVELVYVAGVFAHKELTGDRIAVITHAGGPGVMLTDTLSRGGLKVPQIKGLAAEELLSKLNFGSSVSNPIDFLATGTAEQLGTILDYVDNEFHNIDASAVVFGTTGMFDVTGVYDVLHEKMNTCKKPIYPVLPSVVQAAKAVNHFLSLGRINFTDEVSLGRALCKVYFTPKPFPEAKLPKIDIGTIRWIVENSPKGYLSPEKIQGLLDAAGIARAKEELAYNLEEAIESARIIGFPVAMKVIGPIHKSDVGGVRLGLKNKSEIASAFYDLMSIEGATGVIIQQMLKGNELFIGAKKEQDFGHIILFGLGGVFIEVFKDITYGLAPVGYEEALYMIRNIKSYGIIKGLRGREGVNEELLADTIVRLSALLQTAPEITELDLNPLLGSKDFVTVVDGRIRIS